jgi:hypothetical protein
MGKGGRCMGLTTMPPSCADCLKIWEPQPPGTIRACQGQGIALPLYFFKNVRNENQVSLFDIMTG